MAANNYFGFSHGGTQYGAQPATAYAQPPAQTAYVQQTPQAAYAAPAPPRQPTYETYQAAPQAQTQYTYAARTQPQAPTYDTSKTYYTPTVAAAPAAPQTVYTVAETSYQPAPQAVPVIAAKPAYQTTTYSQPQPIRQTTAIKPQHTSSHSYSSYSSNPSTTSSNTSGNTTKLNSYDAALYSAATSYYQQQQSGTKSTTNTWQKKGTFTKTIKPKMAPKQPQLHYCEVCKISCAGPQTYREHLEGQKHKKKEVALKATTAITTTGRTLQNQLRCELCDVTCTGSDAYAAHIRGAKHQKVVKLHTKLGKPIPSTEPTVMASTSSTSTSSVTKSAASSTVAKTSVKSATSTTSSIKKVLATPKITFIGAGTLKSTGVTIKEEPKSANATAVAAAAAKVEVKAAEVISNPDELDDLLPGEKEVTPVGFEYIEEVKNEFGKVVSFHCKLCECKFNDPNAKLMHMKGRRHRLQYKTKVDPNLEIEEKRSSNNKWFDNKWRRMPMKKVDPHLAVEVKPSIKMRKIQEDKLRKQAAKEEYWRRRDMEERWRGEMKYMMMYEQPSYGYGYGQGMPVRRPDSLDDRHVMAKHSTIYPNEEELQAVQSIVSSCEKALKVVSDQIADTDHPKPMETDKVVKKDETKKKPDLKKTEPKKPEPKKVETKPKIDPKTKKPVVEVKKEPEPAKEEEKKEKEEEKEDTTPAPRVLKGVMRVGVLAKGLLLHNDLNVHLVVLCAEKPTRTLLERVASGLPKHLNTADEKFEVKMCVEEAAIIVSSQKEPKTSCAITMTSPMMRDDAPGSEGAAAEESSTKPDPPDVLDRQKCLDALAALRHAKWFQARANGLQSCVVVIRTLRDLCQRVPTWTPLNQWAMELLVEKCVSSGGINMSPGDALRRVFECISSGILLPGGPGLHDPCEKEPTDAAIGLTNQEREDITASAQHALRLISFRQIHKVLGMDPLPPPKFPGNKRNFNPRKRKATGGSEGAETDEGKKDKKEEEKK